MFDSVRAAAALEGELRQRIYAFVGARRRPATREEVAAAMGISSRLAAFHLDKLLERGLLRAHYARPPGRGGPGAGRPAKRYERSSQEVQISIPERRYDLLTRLLVAAIQGQAPGERGSDGAMRVARERGIEGGRDLRKMERLRRPGPERTLASMERALDAYGFEPYRPSPDQVALGNCPFLIAARETPELVCAITRSFIEGLIRGLGNEEMQAVAERRRGECCVVVRAPETG